MKTEKATSSHANGRKASRQTHGNPHEHPDCLTMSIEQAARKLGISRAHAYASARDGSLPVIRIGGRFLVPKAALERLFETAAA